MEKQIKSWLFNGSHWLITVTAFQDSGGNKELKLNEFINASHYLDGAAEAILGRFCSTDNPLSGILAQFRAPSSEEVTTVEAFTKRFLDRIDPPIKTYQHRKGVAPSATSQSLFDLYRLLGSGTFVDTTDQPPLQAQVA